MTITDEQRAQVWKRAGDCCEYCRVAQSSRLAKFHVDHIIATKHGGMDINDNLCLACSKCNAYKGSNVAAIDPQTGDASKLYHPRQQNWDDHFKINDAAVIEGVTPEGRTTVAVLRMNDSLRIAQRRGDMSLGDYPCGHNQTT